MRGARGGPCRGRLRQLSRGVHGRTDRLAEGVWTWSSRRWRPYVWAALGVLPLLIFWSNLDRLRDDYGTHYWTQGSIADVMACATKPTRSMSWRGTAAVQRHDAQGDGEGVSS